MRLEFEADGSTLALVDPLEPGYRDARRESSLLGARRLVRAVAATPEGYAEVRTFVATANSTHGTARLTKPQVLDRLAWMLVLDDLRVEPAGREGLSLPPPGPPPVAAPAPAPKKKEAVSNLTWVAVELVDEDGEPVAGEEYEIELPDGRKESGRLDEDGQVTIQAVPPGTCKVRFPSLAADAWEPA